MLTANLLNSNTTDELLRLPERSRNPWVSDHVLLTLSVWWVRNTQPQTPDFTTEVATVFDALQRDLQ